MQNCNPTLIANKGSVNILHRDLQVQLVILYILPIPVHSPSHQILHHRDHSRPTEKVPFMIRVGSGEGKLAVLLT